MTDLDADQIRGLTVIGGILLGIVLLVVATAWQATHCLFCNKCLTWKAIRDMKYACENRGDCNLANLVRRARSGEI